MAQLTPCLWIATNDRLHRVDPNTGDWTVVGGAEWRDTSTLVAASDYLHVIQNDRLHRVDPANGNWWVLGNPDWPAPAFLIRRSNALFAIQNGYFHHVTYGGTWTVRGMRVWLRTVAMTATPTEIYAIRDAEPGHALGSLWRIALNGEAERLLPNRRFLATKAMASVGEQLFFVRDDTLFRVDPGATEERFVRLGAVGEWADTKAMCGLGSQLYIVGNDRLHRVSPDSGAWTVLGEPAWPDEAAMAGFDPPAPAPARAARASAKRRSTAPRRTKRRTKSRSGSRKGASRARARKAAR